MKNKVLIMISVLIIFSSLMSFSGCSFSNEYRGMFVLLEAETDVTGEELKEIMEKTQQIIKNRLKEMDLINASVIIEEEKKLRIRIPDENSNEAIEVIGKTAKIKFLLADGTEILSGQNIKDSDAQLNSNSEEGGYLVTIEFTKEGAAKFLQGTITASEGLIPIERIKKDEDDNPWKDEEGSPIGPNQIVIMIDDKVLSAPMVTSPIEETNVAISGGFTEEEANELSMLIRNGALPVALVEVEAGAYSK